MYCKSELIVQVTQLDAINSELSKVEVLLNFKDLTALIRLMSFHANCSHDKKMVINDKICFVVSDIHNNYFSYPIMNLQS